jgi:hypothetical protein
MVTGTVLISEDDDDLLLLVTGTQFRLAYPPCGVKVTEVTGTQFSNLYTT